MLNSRLPLSSGFAYHLSPAIACRIRRTISVFDRIHHSAFRTLHSTLGLASDRFVLVKTFLLERRPQGQPGGEVKNFPNGRRLVT